MVIRFDAGKAAGGQETESVIAMMQLPQTVEIGFAAFADELVRFRHIKPRSQHLIR